MPFVPPLPYLPDSLAQRRSIVIFQGLDDRRSCTLAANVLDAAYEASGAKSRRRTPVHMRKNPISAVILRSFS
jgi:hypothetical protein